MIDVADLLAWLGHPSEPGVSDLLTALEPEAVAFVERETRRYFGASTPHTESLGGDATDVLRLPERPATITSVEERRRAGDPWTEITGAADDGFELHTPPRLPTPSRLLRKNGHTWKRGYEYRVIYPFGYTAGAEPDDVRLAVKQVVGILYHERGREGLRSETIGDYSYSIMATAVGRRELASVPGLAETLARWRGAVYA